MTLDYIKKSIQFDIARPTPDTAVVTATLKVQAQRFVNDHVYKGVARDMLFNELRRNMTEEILRALFEDQSREMREAYNLMLAQPGSDTYRKALDLVVVASQKQQPAE